MPRQLPWLNSGTRTKIEVKPSSKAAGKRSITDDDSDDDFFKGTVLETSRKGKGRLDPFDSDNDLPEVPVVNTRNGKERFDRAPSSSPPAPEMDLPPPQIEFMHKGVDKVHLRDDEWMMVEDEFMETAKLFTKHLDFAHYETLREEIARKKTILRPVFPSSTPSVEASNNLKAKAQAKAQRNAIDDVSKKNFAAPPRVSSTKIRSSSHSGRSSFEAGTPSRPAKVSTSRATTNMPSKKAHGGSDRDDLDAPLRRPSQPSQSRTITTLHTFAKPAIPTKSGTTISSTPSTRPGPNRSTPLDLLDDPPITKPSPFSSAIKPTVQPSTRLGTKFSQQNKPKQSIDLLDEYDPFTSRRDSVPKEQTDRMAKRKVARKKEDEGEKRKSVKLDDIPTFLF